MRWGERSSSTRLNIFPWCEEESCSSMGEIPSVLLVLLKSLSYYSTKESTWCRFASASASASAPALLFTLIFSSTATRQMFHASSRTRLED